MRRAKKPRIRVGGEVRVRVYATVDDDMQGAVQYGWNRAHKHEDDPSEDTILECIHRAVMDALCERFIFTEDTTE